MSIRFNSARNKFAERRQDGVQVELRMTNDELRMESGAAAFQSLEPPYEQYLAYFNL